MTANYAETCKKLGFNPEVQFVQIEADGAISFSTGKSDEIMSLYQSCREKNVPMSAKLIKMAKRLYGPMGYMGEPIR